MSNWGDRFPYQTKLDCLGSTKMCPLPPLAFYKSSHFRLASHFHLANRIYQFQLFVKTANIKREVGRLEQPCQNWDKTPHTSNYCCLWIAKAEHAHLPLLPNPILQLETVSTTPLLSLPNWVKAHPGSRVKASILDHGFNVVFRNMNTLSSSCISKWELILYCK